MKSIYTVFLSTAFAALLLPAIGQAAFVTTNEAGMDGVYSQGIFGANPIDIRFLGANVIVAPTLLNIVDQAGLVSLFGMSTDASPTVNMFFVDTINWCGGFNVDIVGCAARPGNDIVLESVFAGGLNGTEGAAHELGHSLGLPHVGFPNLMTGSVNGNTVLTAPQVAAILGSSLVQRSDAEGNFINIRPILVTAVPIPGALLLLLSGLSTLGFASLKRRLGS